MFIVISPAKKLDFDVPAPVKKKTQLQFKSEANELVGTLKKMKRPEIEKLMKLSSSLADLNFNRFQDYENNFDISNSKQALFAFSGDTYVGLDASSLSEKDIEYAQDHLGILSGLYGLVRPLDLIRPYRLEMGTKLKHNQFKNLYEFWDLKITHYLNKKLAQEKYLINLASNEYFSSIKTQELKAELVTPVFKEKKGDTYKVVGIMAKRARGMMARYIIKNQITKPEDLTSFTEGDYKYSAKLTKSAKPGEMVFTR